MSAIQFPRPITYRRLLTPPAHVDPLGGHDGRVATWRQHGHASPWRCARREPGVGAVEGAGGTCGRGVCGPERVVCQCGGGDGGWRGYGRGGYGGSGGGRGGGDGWLGCDGGVVWRGCWDGVEGHGAERRCAEEGLGGECGLGEAGLWMGSGKGTGGWDGGWGWGRGRLRGGCGWRWDGRRWVTGQGLCQCLGLRR